MENPFKDLQDHYDLVEDVERLIKEGKSDKEIIEKTKELVKHYREVLYQKEEE